MRGGRKVQIQANRKLFEGAFATFNGFHPSPRARGELPLQPDCNNRILNSRDLIYCQWDLSSEALLTNGSNLRPPDQYPLIESNLNKLN